jgi:hypothetical protein
VIPGRATAAPSAMASPSTTRCAHPVRRWRVDVFARAANNLDSSASRAVKRRQLYHTCSGRRSVEIACSATRASDKGAVRSRRDDRRVPHHTRKVRGSSRLSPTSFNSLLDRALPDNPPRGGAAEYLESETVTDLTDRIPGGNEPHVPSTGKRTLRIPSYRRNKTTGRAVVTIDGRDIWLGKFDSPESRQKYKRPIAEWLSNDRHLPCEAPDLTVLELMAQFWKHVEGFYRRPDGTPTSEVANFRTALRPVCELYGDLLARDFGPRCLRAVRAEMIRLRWTRSNINKQVARIKMMFKWSAGRELNPGSGARVAGNGGGAAAGAFRRARGRARAAGTGSGRRGNAATRVTSGRDDPPPTVDGHDGRGRCVHFGPAISTCQRTLGSTDRSTTRRRTMASSA